MLAIYSYENHDNTIDMLSTIVEWIHILLNSIELDLYFAQQIIVGSQIFNPKKWK